MALAQQERLAKIRVEDIRKAAIEHNWELVSTEYTNLDTTLEFICEEGHQVFLPYKKVRDKWECPICIKNQFTYFEEKIIPKKKNTKIQDIIWVLWLLINMLIPIN